MEEGQCHHDKMNMWDGVYAGEAIFGKYNLLWRENQSLYTLNYCIDLRVSTFLRLGSKHTAVLSHGSRLCLIFSFISIDYFSQSIMLRDLCHTSSIILIKFKKEMPSRIAPVMRITQFGGINPEKFTIIYCHSPKPIHLLHQLDFELNGPVVS